MIEFICRLKFLHLAFTLYRPVDESDDIDQAQLQEDGLSTGDPNALDNEIQDGADEEPVSATLNKKLLEWYKSELSLSAIRAFKLMFDFEPLSYNIYMYTENVKTIKFLSARRTDMSNILSERPIFYRSCIKSP